MSLGAIIADTLPDKRAARFAVERTLRELPIDDCLLVSDEGFVSGARHVCIPPLAGLSGYNGFMLDELAGHLRCDAYLVIQWDGYVIDGTRWADDFLGSDYAGAPWPHRGGMVGAGGFSLRSRRLMEVVRDLRHRQAAHDVATAEDLQVCVSYRDALEAAGLRFASPGMAASFAFERTQGPDGQACAPCPTLGFHGVFNFPLVLAEDQILGLLDAIVPRIPMTWPAWHLFVCNAWRRGYEGLGIRLLSTLAGLDGRVWAKVVQASLARGVPSRWLKAAA